MDSHLLLIGLSFVLCAVISGAVFALSAKHEFLRHYLMTVPLSVICATVITIGLISSVWWFPYDFVEDITLKKFLLALASFFIVLIFLLIKKSRFIAMGIILASCVCVFASDIYITILPETYVWLNKIITVLLLYTYSMGFRALSGLNAYPQIQGIVISGGMTLLYFLGQSPFILGISSTSILAAFFVAYLYSKEQFLGIQNSPCLGFVLGWLGLLSAKELLSPCFIIFSMLYLVELIISLARKLTFSEKYRAIAENSASLQVLRSGLPTVDLVKHIINIDILLLIIGVFQLASSSAHSFISLAAIITVWQIYRAVTWQEPEKTFKETSQEIKAQITETLSKLKSKKTSKSVNPKKRTSKKK